MPQFHDLSLEIQIKKLRNTAIASFVIGAIIIYSLLLHDHWGWAGWVALITLQVASGSAIMRADIKRDLEKTDDKYLSTTYH